MSPNLSSVDHDSDKILHVASYHRRDFDYAVIAANPAQHDPVRLSLFRMAGTLGRSGLGRLQRLPLELLWSICLSLDVQSAWQFHHASRGAREIMASIPQYRQLGEHALDCLWALFRTGLAPHIAISTLHSTLSTELCVVCGSFGGFIFLPTAARCCLSCLESAPALRVMSLHSLRKAAGGLAAGLAKSYPVLRSLPGTYSSEAKQHARRRYLVSGHHALAFPRTNEEDARTTLGRLPDSPALRCMAATRLPYVSRVTGDAQLGRCCKGCQIAMEANFCDENFFRRERLYARDGFLHHFQDCEEAKALWLSSEGGIALVTEPEWTRLGGLRSG